MVSLVANILILPFVPVAMLFGFLSVMPLLAPGFALLAQVVLSYILWISAKLAHLPFSSIQVSVGGWGLSIMMILLAVLYALLKRLNKIYRQRVEEQESL